MPRRHGSTAGLDALRHRIRLRALVLTPWTVRNYLVFGRLIPIKSNAAYELWQSQCVTPDGLLQPSRAFASHPYVSAGRQRQEYKTLGEMEFLDKKGELFRQSVAADPLDFIDRVACRFLGATVWYMPFNRVEETRRPWLLWVSRIVHPLPFLAAYILAGDGLLAANARGGVDRHGRLHPVPDTLHRRQLLRALRDAAVGGEGAARHLGSGSAFVVLPANRRKNRRARMIELRSPP